MIAIRPGILVSARTTSAGNVSYTRVDLGQDTDGKTERSRWETARTIVDVQEHKEASEVRSKAAYMIRRTCIRSSFGLICPNADESALQEGIRLAQELVNDFNNRARFTKLGLYVLQGRIADSDEQALRAVAGEVAELLDQMKAGIANLDPKAIRDAANAARQLGAMLDAASQEKVGEAVKAARSAAREIVRRVEKSGEDATQVLTDLNTTPIDAARFAFLDLDLEQSDEHPEAEAVAMPAVNVQRVADLFSEAEAETVGA